MFDCRMFRELVDLEALVELEAFVELEALLADLSHRAEARTLVRGPCLPR